MEYFKIIELGPIKTGTSAKGDWKVRPVLVEAADENVEHPNMLLADLWQEKVNEFHFQVGDTCKLYFNFSINDFNNKHFQKIKIIKFERDDRAF